MRNRNQVVIPLDLGILIDENSPVRKLIEICDELDYTDLYAAYLRHWRKIDPRTMFELLVFAYMNGIYSSRDIESACRHDIRFMWILQNEPVPDHSKPFLLALALRISRSGIQQPDSQQPAGTGHPVGTVLTAVIKVQPSGNTVFLNRTVQRIFDNKCKDRWSILRSYLQ